MRLEAVLVRRCAFPGTRCALVQVMLTRAVIAGFARDARALSKEKEPAGMCLHAVGVVTENL
jgi:hypothetical protein